MRDRFHVYKSFKFSPFQWPLYSSLSIYPTHWQQKNIPKNIEPAVCRRLSTCESAKSICNHLEMKQSTRAPFSYHHHIKLQFAALVVTQGIAYEFAFCIVKWCVDQCQIITLPDLCLAFEICEGKPFWYEAH